MNVTRDVITDLLPLYLDGEASDDTKILVEDFLKQDPELTRMLEKIRKPGRVVEIPASLSKENEMETLHMTKNLLRRRSLMMAFGILFTLWPLSFRFDSTGAINWVWANTPFIVVVFWLLALLCWAGYLRTIQRLKGSAL